MTCNKFDSIYAYHVYIMLYFAVLSGLDISFLFFYLAPSFAHESGKKAIDSNRI